MPKRPKLSFLLAVINIFFLSQESMGALWPDAPWLNRLPISGAPASAVAFISPYDLQFYRMMNIWRRMEKRYAPLEVNFIIVAKGEQGLPGSDEVVRRILREYNYTLPVLLDQFSSYSNSRHAYVSPTVNLVLPDNRTTSFDPMSFDPGTFEKTLQKSLKENPMTLIPPREFPTEGESKNCGHAHSVFVGERFGKAWSPELVTTEGPWLTHALWLESNGKEKVQAEMNQLKGALGILAEAAPGKTGRINIFIDGVKVPPDLRGRDLQEDKSGTFLTIQGLKMYEVISHSSRLSDAGAKVTLSTESKGLRLRALETLPACLEVD